MLFQPGGSLADDLPLFEFDIEPQPVESALLEYAEITDRQILFSVRMVRGIESNAVWGVMSRDEALDRLLEGTNISVTVTRSDVVVIQRDRRVRRDAAPAVEKPASPPPETGHEELVVTGSRLSLEASQVSRQIIVLRQPDLVRTGKPTLGRALSTLPQNYGALLDTVGHTHTSSDNGPANGASNIGAAATVNLRGLSGSGTLVLVNGRRLGTSGIQGGVQDVSVIPISFVERVEIILDGASSIYGADAVGGVVNIITRRDVDNVEAEIRLGAPTSGGNSETTFDLSGGTSWESGNIVANLSVFRQTNLNRTDLGLRAGGSSGEYFQPGSGRLEQNLPFTSPGSVLLRADGTYFSQSQSGSTNPAWRDLEPLEDLKSSQVYPEDLVPRVDSTSLNVFVQQEIGERVRLHGRFGYASRASRIDRGFNRESITLDAGAPWNPTNGLSGQNGDPVEQDVLVRAYYPALGMRGSRSTGVSTSLDLAADISLGEGWNLRFGVSRSRSSHDFNSFGRLDIYSAASRGAFNPWGDGTGSLQDPISWEQPDGTTVDGTVLQFMAREGDSSAWSRNDNFIADARLRGEPFELRAGVAKGVVGIEYRNYGLRGDSYRSGGLPDSAGTDQGAMNAGQDVATAYTEWFLPLFGRNAGVGELGLQTALRKEHYRTSGYFEEAKTGRNSGLPLARFDAADGRRFDAETWMAGLVWSPVDELRIKLNYNTSFVAPDVVQLFKPVFEEDWARFCGILATVNNGIFSTLNGYDPNAPYPDNPLAGCFIPSYSFVDAYSANPDAFQALPVAQLRGGNPDLKPQRGASRSLAAEWFVTENLGARLVWWNTVYRDKFVDLYQDYFRRPEVGADLVNTFPQLFTFHPDGQVATIRSNTVNLDRQKIEGVDVLIDYTPSTSVGDFGVHLNWTYFLENRARIDGHGDLAIREGVGIDTPRHSGLLRLTWTQGGWTVSMDNHYRAATYNFDYYLDGETGLQHEAYWRSNIMASYSFGERGGWLDRLSFRFGINNLLNDRQRSRYVYKGETVAIANTGFNGIYTDPRRQSLFVAMGKSFF